MNVFSIDRKTTRSSSFIEQLTNTEYVYVTDYDGYHLYRLIHRSGATSGQIYNINKWIEEYLQKSFETLNRPYPNIIHVCGTTMFAFFVQNSTISTKNIKGLLLARLEAYDNSKYICYVSVLKEHRSRGLGTRLLNELIKDAIRSNNTRVTLHVNTENKSAISLYLKCGMRCTYYIPSYYFGDPTYSTQNAFTMSLQLKNIRNSTAVCQSDTAVVIPSEEQVASRRTCPQFYNG